MSKETSKNDGAGVTRPPSNTPGLVLCVDAAEARLMRRHGHTCITSVKMRRILCSILSSGREGAEQEAVDAVARLGGVSSADDPAKWSMWAHFKPYAPAVCAAFKAVPIIPTPLRDPVDVTNMGKVRPWECTGTTILVALDTVELVRAADTYAGSPIYRHRGRMDEPFTPQPGKVCLITEDELRLLRLVGEDNTIVFTYDINPDDSTGRVVTPWPASLRALCGERPSLAVGIATWLAAGRYGTPFFLGLTRGPVSVRTLKSDPLEDEGALALAVETNRKAEEITRTEMVWEGGDDLRKLVRYGGLTIYTGLNKRRKVQLRSLGLAKAGELADAAIYGLAANHNTLWAWAATRTFAKKSQSQRDRDLRRVRPSKAHPESTRGYIKYKYNPPGGLRVRRNEAVKTRNLTVAEVVEGGGVTTVPLKTSREGGTYHLNCRAKEQGGEIIIDTKRCKIRSPRFIPDNPTAMLEWLAKQECVVMAGLEPSGKVFAVVKVANGTEDQQRAAVRCWSEEAGRAFPATSGRVCSWLPNSVLAETTVTIGAIHHTNWRALSLATACFERYQTQGDYSKPLKLKRRGTATPLERARAYVDKVPLADEGTRNSNLSTAVFKMVEHFGKDTTADALPYLLAKSTLPDKEKRKTALRILHKSQGERER